MPIFEYVCKDCDRRFEALVYGKQSTRCPQCHGAHLSQLISVFSVRSGSGSEADFSAPSPCSSGGPCCGGNGSCDLD